MPKFSTSVPNPVGKEKARSALEGLLKRVMDKYGDQVSGLEQKWVSEDMVDFVLTTYGFKITGQLVVEDDAVKISGDLPFAAAMFKGKIESSINTELEKTLARAKAEEGGETIA